MNTTYKADIRRKLKVLNYGKDGGNVSKTCRYFGIFRDTYYKWKRGYETNGESALINSKPCLQILNSESQLISKRKFCIRKNCYLGQLRISWYLKSYYDIEVSQVGVWQVLKRNGLNKLPQIKGNDQWSNLSDMKNKFPAIEFKWMLNFFRLETRMEGDKTLSIYSH